MSDLEIRSITADEAPAFTEAVVRGFHNIAEHTEPGMQFFLRAVTEQETPDRFIVALDRERTIGTAGAFRFQTTVPGGGRLATAGVTTVTVRPTHRRRGVLTAMMAHQFEQIRGWGEPFAMLTASETLIYGRFGYGWASNLREAQIRREHTRFIRPVDDAGWIDMRSPAGAVAELRSVHDTFVGQRPGMIGRSDLWWEELAADVKDDRGGASGLFAAVHRDAGGATDGYVLWRIRHKWDTPAGGTDAGVEVRELVALNPTAEAALWQMACNIDIVAWIRVQNLQPDSALPWLLADPRRLVVTTDRDFLWARLVDIPTCLAARTYSAPAAATIAVVDPFLPENSRSYRLEGGRDGATCAVTNQSADVEVDVDALGAAYLGGVRLAHLAKAGRVRERTPGALASIDRAFAGDVPPWCITGF